MKLLAVTLAAMGAMCVTAQAADLPFTRPAPAPVALPLAFSWTGLYFGVNAGYAFSTDSNVSTTGQAVANINNVNGGARPASVSLRQRGFIGGGQVGYNYQFGQFVVGAEADLQYTDLRRSVLVTTIPLSGISTLNNRFSNKLEYLGTLRGRFGFAVDRALIYATGGFAYGETRASVNFTGPAPASVLQFTGSQRRTSYGYTLGGGLEYAITNNLSVKGEYLYYHLQRSTLNVAVIPGSGGGGTGYNSRFRNNGNIIRAGLNYKFSL